MAEKIKVTFLGTSQAIPTAKKNPSAVLLSYNAENILIDCGEGTQRQFRKARLNPCKITRLLITHWHGDHILGIPGLLQTLALSGYTKTLKIYGPKGTKEGIKEILRMFVFVGKIKIEVHDIAKPSKFIDEQLFYIKSEKMIHGPPCNAYSFVEKDKIRIDKKKLSKLKIPVKLISKLSQGKNITLKGKTIKSKDITYIQKGRKFTLITDTRFNDKAIKLAKASDLLIVESNYTNKEKELAHDYKHMTAEQASTIAKKSKSKKLFLTHISQRYQNNEHAVLKEAKKAFKNVHLAEDLMSIEL